LPHGPGSESTTAADRYDATSIWLHWAIVGLVLVLGPTGVVLSQMRFGSQAYDALHMWHRSAGETVFVLILVELWWRTRRPTLAILDDVQWRRGAARLVRGLIVVLLFLTPLTKILRGAFGLGWAFLWIRLPAPFPANIRWGHWLSSAHLYCAYALLALAALHAAAAIWHRVALHDQVLGRMLPARRAAGRPPATKAALPRTR
jgi:cytochrome b561